jgi:hypothetical protein
MARASLLQHRMYLFFRLPALPLLLACRLRSRSLCSGRCHGSPRSVPEDWRGSLEIQVASFRQVGANRRYRLSPEGKHLA